MNGYLVESGAVVERIFAELFHALGQDDCFERFALFKRALFELFDSLADGELLERGAAVECAHRNALNRAGNRYLDRSGALEERVVVNLSDALGDNYLLCAEALRERPVADGLNALGQDYFGQRVAEVESLFGYGLGRAVENNGRKLALSGVGVLLRALERADADVLDVLADGYFLKTVAVHRGIVADCLDRVGEYELLERAAALESLVLETDYLCAVYLCGNGNNGVAPCVARDAGGVVGI